MTLVHYIIIGCASLVVIAVTAVIIRLVLAKKKEKEALYWHYQDQWLLETFDNYDVAVYGFRGSGKDVIFAHAINLKGELHYSNIRYNDFTEVRPVQDLHAGGNTYPDLMSGNIKPFVPNFEEGAHFFVSDAGIYLGCQYHKELDQKYPEIPILLALKRHLYNSHLHTNSQALKRVWDKIREQQGAFIRCLDTRECGDFLYVTAITYTNYESALACLPPPKKDPDEYEVMKYGEIAKRTFRVPISSLEYNTRHFKDILHTDIKDNKINEQNTENTNNANGQENTQIKPPVTQTVEEII